MLLIVQLVKLISLERHHKRTKRIKKIMINAKAVLYKNNDEVFFTLLK